MLSQKWLYNNLGIKVHAQKRTYTYDTVGDTVSDTVSDTVKPSISNDLNKVNDTVNDTLGDTHSDTSKKELLKINIKNNNISKDIYVFKFNIIYKNSSFSIIT